MAKETIRLEGYRELMRAYKQADKDSRKEFRAAFREVGAVVQRDAARRISPIDTRTAAGYKVSVSQRGVSVYQSIRKTTGQHGQYGTFQLFRAMFPALAANTVEVERKMEQALDVVAAHFNHGGAA